MASRAGLLIAMGIMAAAVITAGGQPALAEKRVALVIGNDRYANLPADRQLLKAVNDAEAMGDALAKLGFTVIRGKNLGRQGMIDKLSAFTAQLEAGDTAAFFYAGHGVAIGGVNYLVPSDVPSVTPDAEARVRGNSIAEGDVVAEIQGKGARVALLVLDACRDNPFPRSGTRSIGNTRGLADAKPARGVFTIYSAGIGQTALDRLEKNDPERNSVFTRVFVQQLTRTDLHLGDLIVEVREKVAALALRAKNDLGQIEPHEQTPAYYDQTIGGRVYLAGRAIEVEPAKPAPTAQPAPVTPAPSKEASLPPDLKLETMQGTFFARHNGALVRSGPGSAYAGTRSLKEDESARALGKVVVKEPNDRQRYWYKLEFPDGSQGFSSEDSVFGEKALEEKRSFKRVIASLDEALQAVQTKSFGRFKDGSGVWKGKGCDTLNLPQLRNTIDDPVPGSPVQELVMRTLMFVYKFVYFEDSKVHVASLLHPGKFRVGRLEYYKKLQGITLYRGKMEDGGEGIVVGLKGPQVLISWDSIFKEDKVNVLLPTCTGSDADSLVYQAKRHMERRIEIIWAE